MYSRCVSMVAGTVLLVGLAGVASAGTVITGTVSCDVSGALTVKPGVASLLTNLVTGKTFKETIAVNGTLSSCTGTQTGTKDDQQFVGGSLKAKVTVPFLPNGSDAYPSCLGLIGGGFSLSTSLAPVAKVAWTNSAGKKIGKATVGEFNIDSGSINLDAIKGGAPIAIPFTGAITKGAFLGQQLTATATFDAHYQDLLNACQTCDAFCNTETACPKGCPKKKLICIAGSNAFAVCTTNTDCPGQTCVGGTNTNNNCSAPSDCPGGTCTVGTCTLIAVTGLNSVGFTGASTLCVDPIGCTDSSQCCSGNTCQSLSCLPCKGTGKACGGNSECCSNVCNSGSCT